MVGGLTVGGIVGATACCCAVLVACWANVGFGAAGAAGAGWVLLASASSSSISANTSLTGLAPGGCAPPPGPLKKSSAAFFLNDASQSGSDQTLASGAFGTFCLALTMSAK